MNLTMKQEQFHKLLSKFITSLDDMTQSKSLIEIMDNKIRPQAQELCDRLDIINKLSSKQSMVSLFPDAYVHGEPQFRCLLEEIEGAIFSLDQKEVIEDGKQ